MVEIKNSLPMQDTQTTEQKIIEAAKSVFIEKGFDGARMQYIADRAGINKASLHYYYRSKEKLFDTIFIEAFNDFMPKVSLIIASGSSLFDIIRAFCAHYIDGLMKHPHLPVFVLHELSRRPEKVIEMLRKTGIKPQMMNTIIEKEVSESKIIEINYKHLIINIISLCVFPFVGRPVVQGFFFGGDTEEYSRFLEERKNKVADFIINAIKK
ncbi:MAG: TetR/AcrR family transcriptional regulator [Bacteroidales bacterium]|nr:TetR/AcrR family transcriptional regulator [Bacteroidales bacterium]